MISSLIVGSSFASHWWVGRTIVLLLDPGYWQISSNECQSEYKLGFVQTSGRLQSEASSLSGGEGGLILFPPHVFIFLIFFNVCSFTAAAKSSNGSRLSRVSMWSPSRTNTSHRWSWTPNNPKHSSNILFTDHHLPTSEIGWNVEKGRARKAWFGLRARFPRNPKGRGLRERANLHLEKSKRNFERWGCSGLGFVQWFSIFFL